MCVRVFDVRECRQQLIERACGIGGIARLASRLNLENETLPFAEPLGVLGRLAKVISPQCWISPKRIYRCEL